MNGIEHTVVACMLAFVTYWALQQYHKYKYKTEKAFSLVELGILWMLYLVVIYIMVHHTRPGALKEGGAVATVTAVATALPVTIAPDTYLRRINEHIQTGLPPF